jgi:RNA polymerase-interacting CarD/CdnL/TRCF family regulator
MSDKVQHYDIGQWVVHSRYGVGKIKSVEKIPLYGEGQKNEKCFKVQTSESVFWFPVEQSENPRIRPVASREHMKRALGILKEPPQDMDAHHNVLKDRIDETQKSGSLKAKISLIRDLLARRSVKKLNILEERTLKTLKLQLVREWSIAMDIDNAVAQSELNAIFREMDVSTA